MFTDVVKSEILMKEKVAKGKGRIVSACSIVRTLVSRIIFGRFHEWIIENHLSNGISAGDNMLGTDADLVIRRHLAVAAGEDNHFTGDLSANDARQTGQVLVMAMEEIANFMKEQGKTCPIQDKLAQTFAHSYHRQYHLRGSTIDLWEGSLSSGDPNTTMLNSITNPAYARFSVWKSFNFDLDDFHDLYNENVVDNIMGDDNWFSVSPAWKEHTTEAIMASGYADFGHVYTNDAKDGISDELRSITEIQFLKRTPRYEPAVGLWLMALDLTTVLEIPLWTRSIGKERIPDMEQALKNADTMTRELSYHSDLVWDEWIPKFVKMFSELNWRPKYANRLDMLRACLKHRKVVVKAK